MRKAAILGSLLGAALTVLAPAAAQQSSPGGNSLEDKAKQVDATGYCDALYPERGATGKPTYVKVHVDVVSGRLSHSAVWRSSGNEAADGAAVTCADHMRLALPPQSTGLLEFDWIVTIDWSRKGHSSVTIPNPDTGRTNVCRAGDYRYTAAGVTTVGYRIAPDGAVADLHVVRSSGAPDLDAMTLDCVRTYRFFGALQNETPVSVMYQTSYLWAQR